MKPGDIVTLKPYDVLSMILSRELSDILKNHPNEEYKVLIVWNNHDKRRLMAQIKAYNNSTSFLVPLDAIDTVHSTEPCETCKIDPSYCPGCAAKRKENSLMEELDGYYKLFYDIQKRVGEMDKKTPHYMSIADFDRGKAIREQLKLFKDFFKSVHTYATVLDKEKEHPCDTCKSELKECTTCKNFTEKVKGEMGVLVKPSDCENFFKIPRKMVEEWRKFEVIKNDYFVSMWRKWDKEALENLKERQEESFKREEKEIIEKWKEEPGHLTVIPKAKEYVPYQKCPICFGTGSVLPGFYSPFATSIASSEKCRTCGGSGIIPMCEKK